MDASVPIISLSFRQTTLRQACNNVRCSLPRQTGNAFPAGNGIKHKTRKATSKSSCCRLSYSGTASYIFPAVFCGKRGIRTPGALQLNGFQDRRNRPLCHLSNGVCLHLTGWCRGYRRYVVCICETVYGFLLCGAKVCIFFELCKWF